MSPTANKLYKEAKNACIKTEDHINKFFDRDALGLKAVETAYKFSTYCNDHPANAETLDGWDEVKHQSNTTYIRRALKFLAVGAASPSVDSKVSIWAKVFEYAHTNGYSADEFIHHVQATSMKRWYKKINELNALDPDPANDNDLDLESGEVAKDTAEKTNTDKKPEVDFAARVQNAKHIVIGYFDASLLDGKARKCINANAAFIGFAEIEDDVCRAFANDNDPSFKDAV